MKYVPGEAIMRNRIRVLLIGLCLVVPVIMLSCSLDDNSGPTDPNGGTGNNPPADGSATFNITVTADPPVLEATGADLSEITARIRRADNNQTITNGALVTLRTTQGRLNTDGSSTGSQSLLLVALDGKVEAYLVSATTSGTARVTATVGDSNGSVDVPFISPGDNSNLILTMGNTPVQADVYGYGETITVDIIETRPLITGFEDGVPTYGQGDVVIGCRYTCEDDVVVELEDTAHVTNTIDPLTNPDDYITLIEYKIEVRDNVTNSWLWTRRGSLTERIYPGETQLINYILATINELVDRDNYPLFDLRNTQNAATATQTICTNPDGTQYVCYTGGYATCAPCWVPDSHGGELETTFKVTIRAINTAGQEVTATGEQVVNFADWAGDPNGLPD